MTIRDRLDDGVDFFYASDGGKYDPATHTVTWELGPKNAGEKGSVTLRVTVTERAAADDYTVYNQAFVQVNGDPEQETEIPENPLHTPGPSPTPGPDSTPQPGTTPKPGEPTAPDTGDGHSAGPWAMLLSLCAAGLAAVLVLRRRKGAN